MWRYAVLVARLGSFWAMGYVIITLGRDLFDLPVSWETAFCYAALLWLYEADLEDWLDSKDAESRAA